MSSPTSLYHDLIFDDEDDVSIHDAYSSLSSPDNAQNYDIHNDDDDLMLFEETEVDLYDTKGDAEHDQAYISDDEAHNISAQTDAAEELADEDTGQGSEGSDEEHDGEEDEEDPNEKRDSAIHGIESLVTNFLEQLADSSAVEDSEHTPSSNAKKIEIKLARRDKSSGVRTLKWPTRQGKKASALALGRLMSVLNIAHESLVTDLPTTKRDIYYHDVELFGSQHQVDGLTDDLAATLKLDRSDLNIRASAKGLLCGDALKIMLAEGGFTMATNTDPILIPLAEEISRFDLTHAIAWVLVVEKEAVFQTLCRLGITDHPSLPGPGLIITGKGYPDSATRQLVATLSHNLPESVPIMVMVDGDAYGLDIASVYKFGSEAMKHEAYKLVAGRVECIGLFASELELYGISADAMLPTSKADEKKARAMLKRSTPLPNRWCRELEDMLRTRRKAEIEILAATRGDADINLALEETQVAQPAAHPLLRYLADKISALVSAMAEPQGMVKMEEL